MPKSKPKTLNLEEKVKVFEKSEKGISSRKIAEEMGVGRTQIQSVIF
jgi:transcriptional regulator